MPELLSFESYATAEEATSVAELLQSNGIEAEAFEAPLSVGAIYIGERYGNNFTVKIFAEDFTKASAIMLAQAAILPAEIPAEHPLRLMSDNELVDILSKQDEWGFENYNVALELLKGRGTQFTAEQLEQLKSKRIETLSKRKSISAIYAQTGLVLALLPVANVATLVAHCPISSLSFLSFRAGIAGMCMGFAVYYPKTILPDGNRLPEYDEKSYSQGKFLFYLSLFTFCLNIAVTMIISSLLPAIS